MENLHFNMIAQKTANGKTILIAVVPDDFICSGLPDIFEIHAIKVVSTIYTGTYPTIKLIPETIKDRTEELKGLGIAGIARGENWYNTVEEDKNILGINI